MDAAQKFDETLKTASEKLGAGLSYESVARWLPFNIDSITVENFLANTSLYPSAVPLNARELLFYQAMVREIFRKVTVGEDLNFDQGIPVSIPEELVKFSLSDREAVLLFLDSVAPAGVIDLLGLNLEKLATLICFSGDFDVNSSEKIAEIKVDFGLPQSQKLNLLADDLVLIPAEKQQRVELTINCFAKAKIGKATKAKIITTSGLLGIVFDLRGRPFVGPDLTLKGREQLKKWKKSFGIETD